MSKITAAISGALTSSLSRSFAVGGSIVGPIYETDNIVVLFSELIDPATITNVGDGSGSFELYDSTTSAWVAGALVASPDDLIFAFNPTSDLTTDRSYTVFLSGDITGVSGKKYSNQNFDFTAREAGDLGNWPFRGNANDISGSANPGSVVNALLSSDSNGFPDEAYDMDGNGDRITCMGVQAFPSEGSIAFVFTPSDWSAARNPFSNNYGSGSNVKSFRFVESSGVGRFLLGNDAGVLSQIFGATTLVDGETYLVHLTWSVLNDRMTYYLDREVDGSFSGTINVPTTFINFSFGGGVVAPARDLAGLADWFMMWTRELTAEEIQS